MSDEFDTTGLPSEVQDYIKSLEDKKSAANDEAADHRRKLKESLEQLEETKSQYQQYMAQKGDFAQVEQRLIFERDEEKKGRQSLESELKALKKAIEESTARQIELLPDEVQLMVRDMTPENQIRHLPTLAATMQQSAGQNNGVSNRTGGAPKKMVTLTPEQLEAAKLGGISVEAYAKQLDKVKSGDLGIF